MLMRQAPGVGKSAFAVISAPHDLYVRRVYSRHVNRAITVIISQMKRPPISRGPLLVYRFELCLVGPENVGDQLVAIAQIELELVISATGVLTDRPAPLAVAAR